MNIYLLLLGSPFIFHIFSRILPFGCKRKIEIFLNTVLLIIIVGFRGENVGADTTRYVQHFFIIAGYDFQTALAVSLAHESPFYVLFAWLTSRVTDSPTAYFTLIAGIHFYLLACLINKRSENVPLSYFLYVPLFLTLQLSGVKNCLAVSLLFLALDFAMDKKLKQFLIVVAIAFFFHRTTLVYIIVYPLINIKRLNINVLKYFIALGVSFIFRVPLSIFFKKFGGYEDYGINHAEPWSMALLCIMFVVFSALMKKKQPEESIDNDEYKKLLIVTMIASIFMALVFVNPSALRIVKYFLIAVLLLIPKAFNNLKEAQRKPMTVLIASIPFCIVLGYQFINSVNGTAVYQYMFYWQ